MLDSEEKEKEGERGKAWERCAFYVCDIDLGGSKQTSFGSIARWMDSVAFAAPRPRPLDDSSAMQLLSSPPPSLPP